jgi:chemotaxis signal transduction protein
MDNDDPFALPEDLPMPPLDLGREAAQDPIRLGALLAERAAAASPADDAWHSALASDERPQAARALLEVSLGEARFGVDFASVLETGRVPDLTRVPNTPAWVAGVAEVRGEVLAVLDLAAFLGLNGKDAGAGRLVVVRGPSGTPVGLRVTRLHALASVPASSIRELATPVAASLSRFVTGVVSRERAPMTLLDLDLVLAEMSEPLGDAS